MRRNVSLNSLRLHDLIQKVAPNGGYFCTLQTDSRFQGGVVSQAEMS